MDAKQIEIDESFLPNEDEQIKEGEILGETKTEIITNEDEKTKELSGISALLANLDTETDVSIIVTRLNDRQYKNQFRLPCGVDSQLEVLSWDGEAYPDSHYEYIQKKYGGGHYRFQLRYDGGFKQAWKVVLSDPFELSEKERLIKADEVKNEPVKVQIAQPQFSPPTNNDESFDKMLNHFERLEQFKRAIAPPSPPPSDAPPQTINKESIKLTLVEKCMDEPELLKMAIRSVFDIPPDDVPNEEEKNTIIELIKYVAANPGESKTVLDTILGSVGSVFAPLASLVLPKPPQPIDLNAFRQPRNESPPVPPPQNEPQPTQTAQFEPFVIEDTLPFIELGESENV